MRQTLDFFVKGLNLTFRHIDLFIIYLIVEIPSFILIMFPSLTSLRFLSLIQMIFTLIYISYSLSVPFFLKTKGDDKALSLGKIKSTIFQNLKKIILPILGLSSLLFLFILITLFIKQPPKEQAAVIMSNIFDSKSLFNPYIFMVTVVSAFFSFTSMFFSIEGKSLPRSWILSVKASFKNLNIVFYIILISFLINFVLRLMQVDQPIFYLFRSVVLTYEVFFITASLWLYYEKVVANK